MERIEQSDMQSFNLIQKEIELAQVKLELAQTRLEVIKRELITKYNITDKDHISNAGEITREVIAVLPNISPNNEIR